MAEKEFSDRIVNCLKQTLVAYKVKQRANILYQIIVNEQLTCEPAFPNDPARGAAGHAFQTDILITSDKPPELPLVVIEVKDALTTHDVLTYSAKAARHKSVYPHIRYGLVKSREYPEKPAAIPRRSSTNNSGFDFAICVTPDTTNGLIECDGLAQVIQNQATNAEELIAVLYGQRSVYVYQSRISLVP